MISLWRFGARKRNKDVQEMKKIKQQYSFSRVERRRITEDHFLFVRIMGSEAHVTSPSTLDDWIISKHNGYIILYHRHPGAFSFHEHRRFRSINSAIDEIHSHDAYMMKQCNVITESENIPVIQ